MRRRTAIALIAASTLAFTGAVLGLGEPESPPDTKKLCTGPVVVVSGESLTCDLRPATALTVTQVTVDECDDMGGEFVEPNICKDVNY